MKDTIYIYSEVSLLNIVKEMLFDYKILPIEIGDLNKQTFRNNNVILFFDKNVSGQIGEPFFLNNNSLVFINKNEEGRETNSHKKIDYFNGQIGVKKFIDEVTTRFLSKKIILKNIEIFGEKISNTLSDLSFQLTPLEKEILVVLFENKKIEKSYLLEKILKVKKEIETKTLESHLTRIRAKLLKIKSDIQIRTKDDVFYLDF